MRASPLRVVCLILLMILLAACAWNGLYEGIIATRHADTPGMQAATVTQLLYGVFGLAALLALWRKREWVTPLLIGTGIASSLTAGLAPVVYAGTDVSTGIAAGLITAVVFVLAVWCWRNLVKAGIGNRESGIGNRMPSDS